MKPNVRQYIMAALALVGVLAVAYVFAWQGLTAGGNPDPATPGLSRTAMAMSAGVLVFREGLEAILVLATVAAGVTRSHRKGYVRAVPLGAVAAMAATVATWFAVVSIMSHVNAPELDVQAATGLLAIIVLLVVMNWFFHKIYWTGWISGLNERRRDLLATGEADGSRTFFGLALWGSPRSIARGSRSCSSSRIFA